MGSIGTTFTSAAVAQGRTRIVSASFQTVAGTVQTVVNYTVPAGIVQKIYGVTIDARIASRCRIYHDTQLIGSTRTGPGTPTNTYVFYLPYALPSGAVFYVEFESNSDSAESDASVFVQLNEI